jgi:hypothetical protein
MAREIELAQRQKASIEKIRTSARASSTNAYQSSQCDGERRPSCYSQSHSAALLDPVTHDQNSLTGGMEGHYVSAPPDGDLGKVASRSQ